MDVRGWRTGGTRNNQRAGFCRTAGRHSWPGQLFPRSLWTEEAPAGTVRNAVGSRGAQDEKEAMRGLGPRRADTCKHGDTKSRAFTGKLRNVGRTAVAAHKPRRGERRRFRASVPGLTKTLSDELLLRFRMVGDTDVASRAQECWFIRVGVGPRLPGGITPSSGRRQRRPGQSPSPVPVQRPARGSLAPTLRRNTRDPHAHRERVSWTG